MTRRKSGNQKVSANIPVPLINKVIADASVEGDDVSIDEKLFQSILDALRSSAPWDEHLRKRDLYVIVYRAAYRSLADRKADRKRTLMEHLGATRCAQIVASIVEGVKSIPATYWVFPNAESRKTRVQQRAVRR